MPNNCPKSSKRAQNAVVLHTFGVQVEITVSSSQGASGWNAVRLTLLQDTSSLPTVPTLGGLRCNTAYSGQFGSLKSLLAARGRDSEAWQVLQRRPPLGRVGHKHERPCRSWVLIMGCFGLRRTFRITWDEYVYVQVQGYRLQGQVGRWHAKFTRFIKGTALGNFCL